MQGCLLVGQKLHTSSTVNSLMFVGINVFETKPCLRRFIFAVSSCIANYLGNELCCYNNLFLRFKDGHEFRQINPSQTLMNLQYIVLD